MSMIPPIKERMSVVSQAITLSLLIDSIMLNYNHKNREERTEVIDKIKARTRKYLTKKTKTNKREFVEALRVSQEIWTSTIEHFEEKNIAIEAVSTVIRFYSLYDELLSKNVNLTESLMSRFTLGVSRYNTLEIELNSYQVADMILDKLSAYTGIKRVDLSNLKKGK